MNQVLLIGRLTKDPEIRYTQSGMAVASFNLAIDRPPKQDGTKEADLPRITVFGRQAESIQKYITKGRQIAVEGRIQTGSYTNNNNEKVYTTDVVASRVEFLGSGQQNQNGQNPPYQQNTPQYGYNNQPQQNYQQASPQAPQQGYQQTPPQQQPQQQQMAVPPEFQEIPDDDIPF